MSLRSSLVVVIALAACLDGDGGVSQSSEGGSSGAGTGTSSSGGQGSGDSGDSGDSVAADPGSAGSSEGEADTSGTTGGDSTTTTDAFTSSDSSGGIGYCSDGQIDPENDEECDNGELDSPDCVLCQRVRIIFLTSTLLQGGAINGLTGADAYCRSLALKAQQEVPDSPIVEPKNFKALLSTSTESIGDRHFLGKGPYQLVNGLRVSRGFIELFTEPHENPINVNERSETMHNNVWTGTDVEGEPYPGIDFCGDWHDFNGTANFGNSDQIDSDWIHAAGDLNPDSDCGSARPIYCVEQE